MDKLTSGKVIDIIVIEQGAAFVCEQMTRLYRKAAREAGEKDPDIRDKYNRLGDLLDPRNLKQQDPVIMEPAGIVDLK